MNTLDTYTCTDSWGLVYDAASSGDFIGTIQEITGYRSLCYIGSGIPGNDNAGFVLSGGFLQISVHAANKLYAKRYPGDPYSMPKLSLAMANITVVGGAAPVGSAPTVNPVGVSGIDGSGLKRSLLTDSIGQMMTTEQDSAVFTASATSASVLFTVDMTNWRSVLLQVTSAGSSCTVSYECSNDQSVWYPVMGNSATYGYTSTVGAIVASSTTAVMQMQFPKRAKYFRARVSVYGSGTVSVAYTLSLEGATSAATATVWGQAGEASAVAGNPVTIGVECRNTRKTAVGNGQVVRPIGTVDGKLIVRNHSIPENEWKYAAASGGIVNTTTPVTLAAAAGAGLSAYITSMQIRAQALGNATEIVLLDGLAAVYWRSEIGTAGLPLTEIVFEDPIKLIANSSLTFATVTASGTGAVYVNAQGYYAP